MVVIARAELIALSPSIFSEAGLNNRVGTLVAPLGVPVTAAVSVTAPLKPFDGIALTPTALWVVAAGATVNVPGLAVRLKAAAPVVASLTSARSPSVCTYAPVESRAVISTSFIPFADDELAFSVTVMAALPPLFNVANGGTVQVIPEAAVQLRLTVPAKPFTDAT